MKKLLIILFLFEFSAVIYAQPKNGFFKPVDDDLFTVNGVKAVTPSVWLFRPAVELSALQLTYDKTLKQFNSTSLTSAGLGVGYQHFIEVNGVPYNNVGFNILILFGVQTTEDPASISLAATVSALKVVNVGFGYDFSGKKVFFLTGIAYNFN